jgi:outer membrane protein assembly factor BamB
VRDGLVFSATTAGVVWCHEAATGREVWRLAVTNSPLAGTPATDGTLLYLPADDGLHLVSAAGGRAVRRYPSRLPVRSAPVVAGGTLLFAATDGNVYGAAPGRPLEKLYETGQAGSQIVAAPAFGDGCLFVAATNGVLYALAHRPHEEAPPGAH